VSTLDLSTARWFKSSRSTNNGDCVEFVDHEVMAIRRPEICDNFMINWIRRAGRVS
jgi:hypothetical protein